MTKYHVLKMMGVLCILAGITLAVIGLIDFFSMTGWMDGVPEYFWLSFIGLPLLGIGGMLLAFGFRPEIERHALRHRQMLIERTLLEKHCPCCAAPVPVGARFCANCGARLEP